MRTDKGIIVCDSCDTAIRNGYHIALSEYRVVRDGFITIKEHNQELFCSWKCVTIFAEQRSERPLVIDAVTDVDSFCVYQCMRNTW